MERSNRDMFRQFEEQSRRDEELVKENRALRQKNHDLENRIITLEKNFEDRIALVVQQAVDQATKPLKERIVQLEAANARKDIEIARLKSQIDKDSSNSSKPPSSDGLKKIPNNREKSERKSGGQPHHKGHRISIPKDLKEQVVAGKAEHIIKDETNGALQYMSDWEVDLKIIPVYTETRRPAGAVPVIRYGKNIKAVSVYLLQIGMLSLERLAEFIECVTNELVNVSQASLLSFCHSAAEKVDMDSYKRDLLNGAFMHVDETPVRTTQRVTKDGEKETVEHSTYNAYIRTYSNNTTTLLTANGHKDIQSVETDGILPAYCGVLCHDHEAKFYHYGDAHATCGAHLLRELSGLFELYKLKWADDVRQFFLAMHKQKETDMKLGCVCCDSISLHSYEQQYDQLIEQGEADMAAMKPNSFALNKLRCMVKRLKEYKDCYLLFMRRYAIPFTNNQAERDLRHCKTKQKVSGCYRTWLGLTDYCKLRTLTDTAKKRHQNVLTAICSCFC